MVKNNNNLAKILTQSCVWSYLLTLSTGRSRDSNSTSQTTNAIFARGTITSLGSTVSLKRRFIKITCGNTRKVPTLTTITPKHHYLICGPSVWKLESNFLYLLIFYEPLLAYSVTVKTLTFNVIFLPVSQTSAIYYKISLVLSGKFGVLLLSLVSIKIFFKNDLNITNWIYYFLSLILSKGFCHNKHK